MRAEADPLVLFAGPTLAASSRARLGGVIVRPPVKRGDIARLVECRAPGAIAICDGVFHDALAVGHAEIREAVRKGFRVWGLSSMGAIRAREMHMLGVRGFGAVFARFMADGDFQDDEVALLHEPGPSYRAVSEPLIHLRAAIAHLANEKLVQRSAARGVVRALKSRWYGERTIRLTVDLLAPHADVRVVREVLGDFYRFAVKSVDLERFLEERPWTLERGGKSHGSETAYEKEDRHHHDRRSDAALAVRGRGRPVPVRDRHPDGGRRSPGEKTA
jgi:hypothetical protein